jgi:nucleoside-diphosphate-sugar epimerase
MCENPHTYGKAFNITNGDYWRMNTFWPEIAKYFGMEAQVAEKPFSIQEFINDKKDLWNQMMEKYNLEKYPLEALGTWKFMEGVLTVN